MTFVLNTSFCLQLSLWRRDIRSKKISEGKSSKFLDFGGTAAVGWRSLWRLEHLLVAAEFYMRSGNSSPTAICLL